MLLTSMQLGLSAQAIAGRGKDHPWDPSDLRRCMAYCEYQGISTTELTRRMQGRSVYWDRLLPHWDRLVALLRHEIDTRTDRLAPLTFIAMGCVIHDGTPCETCSSTGRGAECAKCSGTGRRGGGRCRAAFCEGGAAFCPTCHGQGYTTVRKGS